MTGRRRWSLGGISSGKHINALREALIVNDDCDLDSQLTYSTPSFSGPW